MTINIVYTRLHRDINALVTVNDDDSYTILVNTRLSKSEQMDSVLHEIAHIQNNDFFRESHVNQIESERHSHVEVDLEFINFFYHYV